MAKKLNTAQKRYLRWIAQERTMDGWCQFDRDAYQRVKELIPPELVWRIPTEDGGGRFCLTPLGQCILDAMKWL
jgi:hypothetical protein